MDLTKKERKSSEKGLGFVVNSFRLAEGIEKWKQADTTAHRSNSDTDTESRLSMP